MLSLLQTTTSSRLLKIKADKKILIGKKVTQGLAQEQTLKLARMRQKRMTSSCAKQ
jgi:cell division GTPase FtsZ